MKTFIAIVVLFFSVLSFANGTTSKTSFLEKAPGIVAKEICTNGSAYKKCSQFTDEECLSFATTVGVDCGQKLSPSIPANIPRVQVPIWISKLKSCASPLFVERATKMTPPKFDNKCFISAIANK